MQADYVWTGTYHDPNTRNVNLSYNPATGVNYPFTDITHLPYPDWGVVSQWFSEGHSNYRALQTALTKRFNQRWQLSATYTFVTQQISPSYGKATQNVDIAYQPRMMQFGLRFMF